MISICIPVYEMAGQGINFLDELLRSIEMQTYQDYEVMISDNSKNNDIEFYIANNWDADSRIKYFSNPGNNPSQNLNNAIDHATGDIIKPMFQDDKFIDEDTLLAIHNIFKIPIGGLRKKSINWIVFTSRNIGKEQNNIHQPWQFSSYKKLLKGENTYGSPSAIAFRKTDERFDENLIWLMDCEFYVRLLKKFELPYMIKDEIFIRQWPGQMTNTIASGQIRITETEYVLNKHNENY